VKLFDTAGLRETEEIVEREGIRRAREVIGHADLILLLSEKPGDFVWSEPVGGDVPVLRVATKIDRKATTWSPEQADVFLSTKTGDAVAEAPCGLPETGERGACERPSRRGSRHPGGTASTGK
jgi:tRNA modification GTPase